MSDTTTTTQEALAAMAKAEDSWNKMIDETVQISGQFQKDCEEAFADIPEKSEQDARFLA